MYNSEANIETSTLIATWLEQGGESLYAAEWKLRIRISRFQVLLGQKALFLAAFVKLAQACSFLFSKAEAQVFAVITATKIAIELFLFGDQFVDAGQVLITQAAQTVGDWFGIDNLGADKPERVHERKTDNFVPLFAEVPEIKFVSVQLTKTNRLIANE